MTANEIAEACRRLCERRAPPSFSEIVKPTLPEVRPLVDAYYELPGNGAGGELHVVLDDCNWQRKHIEWCHQNATKIESRWLASVLLLLSNSQRRRL